MFKIEDIIKNIDNLYDYLNEGLISYDFFVDKTSYLYFFLKKMKKRGHNNKKLKETLKKYENIFEIKKND